MHDFRPFAPYVSVPAAAVPGSVGGLKPKRRCLALALALALMTCCAQLVAQTVTPAQPEAAVAAQAASTTAAASSPAAAGTASAPPAPPPVRRWATVPRVFGRLTAADLGIVINEDDPYSIEVGEYYARARRIPAARVLRVKLPLKATLTRAEFEAFSERVNEHFGPRTQALALAWRQPYAVECNSITGALAMGFDGQLCGHGAVRAPGSVPPTCGQSRRSTYFGSPSTQPLKDHQMRLSMLLASRDVASAKALIDRGVQSDGKLGRRGGVPVRVHFVTTSDAVRSQRQVLFPPAGMVARFGIDVALDQTDALRNAERVLIYMTGRTHVEGLDTIRFVPGALADHLTSFGGALDASQHGQMTAQAWLDAGATASYGTTSEPCSHLQKFPHPQALLMFYVQGATALEAYWKSVMWPQQGLFIGEPLAAPFSR